MPLSGVEVVNPQLSGLKPLLKAWTRCVVEYAERAGEPPYWCNERADVSILAGAAWRLGGICLEEFSTDKGAKSAKRKGRADLYFQLGKTDYALEAKHVYVRLKDKPTVKRVARHLGSARRDAMEYDAEDVHFRIGAVFAVPAIKEIYSARSRKLFDVLLPEIRRIPHDFMAWQFLPTAPETQIWDDDFRHPGVILLGTL